MEVLRRNARQLQLGVADSDLTAHEIDIVGRTWSYSISQPPLAYASAA
jgi:hypothetical protein